MTREEFLRQKIKQSGISEKKFAENIAPAPVHSPIIALSTIAPSFSPVRSRRYPALPNARYMA